MEFDPTTVFHVVLMAIVQGIAEFLPISSSGHLLVLGRLFTLPDVFTLSILLHAGTLFSVLVFFAKDIVNVIARRPRAIALVVVGTIPTVAVAFAIMHYAKFLESSRLMCGIGFFITAFMLLTILRRYGQRSDHELYFEEVARSSDDDDFEFDVSEPKSIENSTFFDAIIIGFIQGIAALPGISRSGATISTALARRFSREWAAEFSFYLSIPVIAGGACYEMLNVFKSAKAEGESFNLIEFFKNDPNMALYLGGAVVSFIVGWLSLFSLMRLLKAGKLHYFAYWLIVVGVACISWTVYDHWNVVADFWNNNETIQSILTRLPTAPGK